MIFLHAKWRHGLGTCRPLCRVVEIPFLINYTQSNPDSNLVTFWKAKVVKYEALQKNSQQRRVILAVSCFPVAPRWWWQNITVILRYVHTYTCIRPNIQSNKRSYTSQKYNERRRSWLSFAALPIYPSLVHSIHTSLVFRLFELHCISKLERSNPRYTYWLLHVSG
jgi:hypothetical protein